MKNTAIKNHSSKPVSKLLALLLSLAMVLTLAAGCSSNTESTAPATADEDAAAANAETVQAEAEPQADAPENSSTISYPLENSQSFTYFYAFDSNTFGGFMDNWYDIKMYSTVAEKTGITLDFISPSSSSESEQFNLTIASGEYPDFMNVVDSYSGGVETALEEEVIVDLTDYIETCAPDYWDKVQNSNDVTRHAVVTDEGKVLSIYSIMNTMIHDSGLLIRKDWLDELNLDIPETKDELFDAMVAIKETYDPDKVLDINGSADLQYIVGAFGISGISLSGGMFGASDLGIYIGKDGKTAESTLQSEGYREYIEYLIKLYENGIIDRDFYSETGFGASAADIATGACAIIRSRSDNIPSIYALAESDTVEVVAMSGIVGEKGDTYEFGDIPSLTAKNKISISSQCEDLETALNYLNWFFTDEAYMICNYGEEGVAFEYDEDNIPTYTELLTNNQASNLANIRHWYCFMCMPMYIAQDAMYHVASDVENEACEVWDQMGYAYTMPDLIYTSEESSIRSLHTTDIISHAAEVIIPWIIGQTELTDDAWSSLQEDLIDLGINEVLACEQSAFDRYLSR